MSPPITLNRVDFPQPDGPITAKNSPGATVKDTRSIAVSAPSGVSKRLTMSSTTRIGSVDLMRGAASPARSGRRVALGIAQMLSPSMFSRRFGRAGERRGHRRRISRLHAHVDDGPGAVLDRRDRLRQK